MHAISSYSTSDYAHDPIACPITCFSFTHTAHLAYDLIPIHSVIPIKLCAFRDSIFKSLDIFFNLYPTGEGDQRRT